MNGQRAKEVTFERKTILDAQKFNTDLEKLSEQVISLYSDSEENDIGMKQIRLYLLTGEKNNRFSDDIYAKIDELQSLRQEAIQSQKQYLNHQERKSGIKLPKDIISGKSLAPGFSPALLDKFPHLKIYSYFMWYSKNELDLIKQEILKNDGKNFETLEAEIE